MILENVNVTHGTTIAIVKTDKIYNVSSPFSFLSILAKVIFVSGVIGLIAFFPAQLIFQLRQKNNKREKLQKFLQISYLIKIFGSTLSFLIFLLLVIWLVALEYPYIPAYVTAAIWLSLWPLVALYWLNIEKILSLFLAKFGYKRFLSLRKIIAFILFTIMFYYAILLASWIISDPTFFLEIWTIAIWCVIPLAAFLALLLPFVDPLKLECEALLSLKEFLSEVKRKPEDANFGYVQKASKRIASLLRYYNYPISSDALSEYIIVEQLSLSNDDAQKETTTQKIVKALSPLKLKDLINAISQVPDLREKQSRLSFDRTLEHLTSVVLIITTIISWILSLYK